MPLRAFIDSDTGARAESLVEINVLMPLRAFIDSDKIMAVVVTDAVCSRS